MVKLDLVVTHYGDCNKDIIQSLHIVTHDIPADKGIQLLLHQVADIHIRCIQAHSQLNSHNGD